MGTLVLKIYPTNLALGLADHTYVECDTGGAAWGCWGGKIGGKEVMRGDGSTKRANMIAGSNERAGITCYLINGVCHQAANRILLAANVTIDRNLVRGYSLSQAMFGAYGRIGFWPCKAPFNQFQGVTGDLPECIHNPGPPPGDDPRGARHESDRREEEYRERVLSSYGRAARLLEAREVDRSQLRDFHAEVFRTMAEHNLGSILDEALSDRLSEAREKVEQERLTREEAYTSGDMNLMEFVGEFNRLTIDFQDEMANILTPEQYEALLDLKPDERVTLADPRILATAFDTDITTGWLPPDVTPL